MTTERGRTSAALVAVWPAGVALAVGHQEVDALTTPAFVVLATIYATSALLLLHRLGALREAAVGTLAVAPIVLFTVAGYTGAPTGDEPSLLVVNTTVLLVVATALLVAATSVVVRHRRSPAVVVAGSTVALLLLGTAGYLVNLLARYAVVLTGLAERQAAVEETHWVAAEYLRGLPPQDDFVAYLLTWMDLVQLGYVVTAYVGTAGLARLLVDVQVVGRRAGRCVERCAWAASALLVASIALSGALPRTADAVPAGLAFGLSIPFMTTLLPYALAACVLGARGRNAAALRTSRREGGGTPHARPSRPGSPSLV